MALTALAAQKDRPLEGFGLFGVVKETGVDDEGLATFNSKYFPHPLYLDRDRSFYDALGGRKLTFGTWNPFKLFRDLSKMNKRVKAKKIQGNFKGEGFVQGGIIIFGKDGKPKYAYEEDTGSEIPVADILAAVNAVKVED